MPGTIFVEGKLLAEVDNLTQIQDELTQELSRSPETFHIGEDLLNDRKRLEIALGKAYVHCNYLESMKVTDYSGSDSDPRRLMCFRDVRIKVVVYRLYHTKETMEVDQAELTSMPHTKFATGWDNLLFGNDLKGDLLRIIANMLRFSRGSSSDRGADMNRIILCYGPPGTGKTSLCEGLAQKIAIRHSAIYQRTKLIQIRTATLLSKYYSESAKQVDQIFTTIEEMCEEDSEQFICVLIDEVESIAGSRESSMHGEAQDSLRATNALLTGLDRAKRHRNAIFLCTSNMHGSLDTAFLDRCGLKIMVSNPGSEVRYEILRSRLESLIDDGTILSDVRIPSYGIAQLEYDSSKETGNPGSKLVRLIKRIAKADCDEMSGRSLTQLPQKSIWRYLGEEDCSLDMALQFMERTLQETGAIPLDEAPPTCPSVVELGDMIDGMRRPKRKLDDMEHALRSLVTAATDVLEIYNKRLNTNELSAERNKHNI